MKLKDYTHMDYANVTHLVEVRFNLGYKDSATYCIKRKVVRVLPKSVEVQAEGKQSFKILMRKIGWVDYHTLHCLPEDVETLVKEYYMRRVARLEDEIKSKQLQVDVFTKLSEDPNFIH